MVNGVFLPPIPMPMANLPATSGLAAAGVQRAALQAYIPPAPMASPFSNGFRGLLVNALLFPITLSLGTVPWNTASGKTEVITPMLRQRIAQLKEKRIDLSKGFGNLLEQGKMKADFAELLILGITSRIDKGKKPADIKISEVIARMREILQKRSIIFDGLFSAQFHSELEMSEMSVDDFFVIVEDAGKTYLATKDEPPDEEPATSVAQRELIREPHREPVVIEVVEGKVVDEEIEFDIELPRDTTPGATLEAGAREMALAPRAGGGIPGTALSAPLPSEAQMAVTGVVGKKALHALAIIDHETAIYTYAALKGLALDTDPRTAANAIRAISRLYRFAPPEEKRELLKKLADIFLRYDPAEKTESAEAIARIRKETILALREIGIQNKFVGHLENFVNGNPQQKSSAIRGMAVSMTSDMGDEFSFTRYLTVRVVLAEIERGSSPEILNGSIASVQVIAKYIIAEKMTSSFVHSLMIRGTGAEEITSVEGAIYKGLKAILDADPFQATSAMLEKLDPSDYQTTDILLYRVLTGNLEGKDQKDDKEKLAKRMAVHYIYVARMEPRLRELLRNSLRLAGASAVSPIIDEYKKALVINKLSQHQKEDIFRLLDSILSDEKVALPDGFDDFMHGELKAQGMFGIFVNLQMLQRADISPSLKKSVYEKAAEELYDNYRINKPVLDGVNSLEAVGGKELLAFYREKYEKADNDLERKFYIERMAVKIAGLQCAKDQAQAADIAWAFEKALDLFIEHGKDQFETLLLFFSARSAPIDRIITEFNGISMLPKDTSLPGRDRALLVAMAGNTGLPSDFLHETVCTKLEKMARGVFDVKELTEEEEQDEGLQPAELTTAVEARPATKLQDTSVTFAFEYVPTTEVDKKRQQLLDEMATELRKSVSAFVKERPGRYGFDSKTGTLTVRGIPTDSDMTALEKALAETQNERNLIGKPERAKRITLRMEAIADLPIRAAENARKAAERTEDAIRQATENKEAVRARNEADRRRMGMEPITQVGDDEYAADVFDVQPLERFKEAVSGLIKLCSNSGLIQLLRDFDMTKIIKLHNWALEEAKKRETEARKLDDWSFAVINPIAELFTSSGMAKFAPDIKSRIYELIIKSLLYGSLSISSRRAIWKMFSGHLDNVSTFVEAIKHEISSAITSDPTKDWSPEREFIKELEDATS